MTEGHDGAMEEHARPAPTHDGAYLFAHITAVAMDRARRAEGLHVHTRTADDAFPCVVKEAAAVGAQCGCTVCLRRAVWVSMASAVEGDHLCHDIRFHCSFFFGVHASLFSNEKKDNLYNTS